MTLIEFILLFSGLFLFVIGVTLDSEKLMTFAVFLVLTAFAVGMTRFIKI